MPLLIRRRSECRQRPVRVVIRRERHSDVADREKLLDAAFGPGRFAKTSERLREGRKPALGLALVAHLAGRLVGTLRLWPVVTGTGHRCLLLGPLAVAADLRGSGIGAELMRQALQKARARGHRAVVLVGDAAYYSRFGFSAATTAALRMPGPYERDRLLACELVPDALGGARGTIAPIGPRRARLSGFLDRMTGIHAPAGQPA